MEVSCHEYLATVLEQAAQTGNPVHV